MNQQSYRYPSHRFVQTGSNQHYSPSNYQKTINQTHRQSASPLVSINHEGLRKQHLLIKFIPIKNQLYNNSGRISEELFRINRNYRIDLTPFTQKKPTMKHRQTVFANKAVQLLSPRTNISIVKEEQVAFNILKERISKFIKQGSKIAYKYKKSVASVEKRKRDSERIYTERAEIVRSEAKTHLHSMLKRPLKKNWEETYENKLFYFDRAATQRQREQREGYAKCEQNALLQKDAIHQSSKSSNERRLKTENQYLRNKQIFAKHKQLVNKKLLNEHLNKLNKSRILENKAFGKIVQNTTKIRFRERKTDIKVTKLSPIKNE